MSHFIYLFFLALFFSLVTQVLWLDEERIHSDVSSNLEAGLHKQLPQQTSPHPSIATEVMEDCAL